MTRLSEQEAAEALAGLPGWSFDAGRGAILKSFRFAGFAEAFGFMTAVAIAAEKADHHPDWSNSWNRVDILLTTHSAGGLTARDLDLAGRIEALAGSLALGAPGH